MPTLEPRLAGLTNTGIAQFVADARRDPGRIPVPLMAQRDEIRSDGKAAAANSFFITALSMPAAEPSTPQPDVGDVRELQQSLDGPVLAVGAVQHREHDVDARRG